MDQSYDDEINTSFGEIKPNKNNDELSEKDIIIAKSLSALDYLNQNDLDNALEVLEDIEEFNTNKEQEN